MLKLRIDGRSYQLPVTPEMSLLQVIQEQLHASRSTTPQESSPTQED